MTNRNVLVMLLTLSPTAFGQSEAREEQAEESVVQKTKNIQEMTVTAFRVPQAVSSLALTVSSLDEDSLNTTSHIHIQEAVNRLAGINIHRNNGQEYLAAVRSPVLTGAGSCGSLLTAEDGLPLRPTGFCNVNELFEAHTEAASTIDVLKGPGTAVFGSSAMHGVINVRNPAPLSKPLEINMEAGAYDFGRLGFSGGNEKLGGALTVTTDGGFRDESGYEQQKLSLSHYSELSGLGLKSRFTITNLDQETAGFLVGTDAYKDKSLIRTNPNPEAFRKASAARFSTSITSTNTDAESHWEIRPYLRYSQMDFLQHFLPGQPLEENGHHSLGFLSSLKRHLNPNLELITGLDLEYADSWLRQSQEGATEGSNFLQETVPSGLHYDYEVQSLAVGPYAHLNWQLTDDLVAGFGARLERVSYDYNNLSLDGRTRDDGTSCGFGGCRYSRPGDRDDSFTQLSPKLSISYKLIDGASVYLNYSNGFRAPEITELYRLQRNQSLAELDSEEIDSFELGGRYLQDRFSLDLSIFRMKKSNVILRDVDFFNISNGKTSHQGLELQVSWQFARAWSLDVAATYVEHQYDNNPGLSRVDIVGNDIDTAPKHFGSTRLTRRFNQRSKVELEWQHMGQYFTDPENLHSYEGHDLFHLRALWQWNKNWTGSLRLNNLLDDRYAERADFTSFSGDRYFPGQPRRIYIGLSYQL